MRGHRRIIRAGGMQGAEAGSASVITPKSIFGNSLELWLRADMGITIGTGVSAWADRSAKNDANRNVTQATDANQPTLNASDADFGGKPSVQSTSTQWLRSAGVWSASISQPFSVFFVGKIVVAGGVLFDGSATDSTLIYDPGAFANWREFAGANLNGSVASSTAVVGLAVFNGASSSLYLNAQTPTNGNAGASNMGTGNTILNDGSHVFGGAKAAEVCVISVVPSAAQVAALLSYGSSRYGIAVGP